MCLLYLKLIELKFMSVSNNT